MDVALAADLADIPRLAGLIEAFAEGHDLPPTLAFNLNLALDELITNVVTHGLDEPAPGAAPTGIQVSVSLDDGHIRVVLEDEGKPFDPFQEAPPPDLDAELDDRRIGGLGVHLVTSLIAECAYERRAERNRITLRHPVS